MERWIYNMANEVVKETKNEIKDLGQKAITNILYNPLSIIILSSLAHFWHILL